jgi:regulatory protein
VAAALSLKARALRYLAMREHSRAELARKLARHVEDSPGDPADARIQRALDELAERGLLDEQRAADALVTAQAARFGALKLRQSLRTRGVGAEEAALALAAVEGTELDRARAVWRRRFGPGNAGPASVSPADRARQARFLAGRGFSGDVIRRVVRGLDDDPDSGDDA